MSMEVGTSNAYLPSPKHSWWSTQTTKEKKLIIGCLIAAVLAIIFFMCTIIVGTRTRYELNCAGGESKADGNKTTDKPTSEVCTSKECKQTAFRLKINLNEDVDPCQNFYDFACGGFDSIHKEGESTMKDAENEFDRRRLDIGISMLKGTVKDETNPAPYVYRSCIYDRINNKSDINAIKNMVSEVLGTEWPMAVGESWKESIFDYSKSLGKLLKLQTNFFLKIGLEPDPKNYTRYLAALVASQTPVRIPQNMKDIFCMLYSDCDTISGLDKEIAELKDLIEVTTHSSETVSSKTKQEVITVILKAEAVRNAQIEKFTISKITELIPQIQWTTFFQTLYEGTGFKVPSSFEFLSILEPLKTVIEKYTKNKRLLANAIAFSLVETWGPLYSTQIDRMWNPEKSSDELCGNFLNKHLGFAFGKLYIDEYLPKAALTEITGVTLDLKAGFRKMILGATWLDTDTKNKALEKIDNMVSVVASPAFVFNDTRIKEYYKTVSHVKGESFVLSSRAAVENGFQQGIKMLSIPIDRTNSWVHESPFIFNAFYNRGTNAMYYPLGMLISQFFSPGRTRAIKYASLGYIAGHEIGHGFDSLGKDYDKNGILNNWWDPETAKQFEDRAKCFVDQYSSIKDELSGMNLNGNLTLAENIADNGGLRAAYQAYKDAPEDRNGKFIGLESYSEDQVFFIAAAQSWCDKKNRESMKEQILTDFHSPHKYRGYVPFLNFPEFAKSFQCKEGTPMNPKTKCEIW